MNASSAMSATFTPRISKVKGAVAVLSLLALKLFLATGQARYGWTAQTFDDGLFIKLAAHIVDGQWLGPYDQLTLVKGAGYPLWIAANSFLPVPLYVADQLLYALASAVLVMAIRPLITGPVAVGVFALVLFNPFTTDINALRFLRFAIYPAQTLLVVGCLLGCIVRRYAATRVLLAWSAGLGVSLGSMWITREEGIWIVPTLGVGFVGLGVSWWRTAARDWRRPALIVAVCGTTWLLPTLGVVWQNYEHYGVFATTGFKNREFLAAYGALSRVDHLSWKPYVPVPRETRERIYEVSPAFREIRSFLDGPLGDAWTELGRQSFDFDASYDDELLGSFFIWVFRHSVALAEYHLSPQEAAAYYSRLAREVNDAVDSGVLRGGPPLATLTPPPRREHVWPLLGSMVRAVRLVSTFDLYSPQSFPTDPPHDVIHRLTGDSLVCAEDGSHASCRGADAARVDWLQWIGNAYQLIIPIAIGICLATFVAILFVADWRRRSSLGWVGTLLLLAIGTRVVLVAYIDVSSFFAVNPRYLAPVYPLLLAFCGLVAVDASGVWARRARHH